MTPRQQGGLATGAALFILLLGFSAVVAVPQDNFPHRHHSSTTTTTTSTGPMEQQTFGMVYGADSGCPMLTGIPNEVTRIDQNFTATDSNGDDAWSLQFVQSGNNNETSVMFFTSDNGNHTAGEYFYKDGTLVYNQTLYVDTANGATAHAGQPLLSDVIQGQFVDFYTGSGNDADGGQIFWYTIGANQGEQFTYNFQNVAYPDNFTVQSDSMRIEPITGASSVIFSAPDPTSRIMDTQLGQQFQGANNALYNVPITFGVNIDPCANPIQNESVTSTNICGVNQNLINDNSSISQDWTLN